MRTIPMLDTVKDAFEMIWEEQKENGWTDAELDGMTGFVFCNRYGNIMNAQSVNRAIKRISSAYYVKIKQDKPLNFKKFALLLCITSFSA